MNTSQHFFRLMVFAFLGALTLKATAQETPPMAPVQAEAPAPAEEPAAPEEAAAPSEETTPSDDDDDYVQYRHQGEMVAIGRDSLLEANETSGELVAVFGSAINQGEVYGDVVSVLGDTHSTGPIHGDAVAVIGNMYINNVVHGDVVAVIGNVDLGPQADIAGAVVCVGGRVSRHPDARVRDGVSRILGDEIGGLTWLQPWVRHALLWGRPLAFADGLGWAWGIAFGFLALYALLALMFRGAIDDCVTTLEQAPGKSLLASILTVILTPVVFVVLLITVIGIALVPFLGAGLMIAGIFGKAVVLAGLGRRITQNLPEGPAQHPAAAVVVGGLLVMLIYVIPIVGFIAYKLLGMLGTGVVIYTLLERRSRSRGALPPPPAPALAPAPVAAGPSGAAAAFVPADAFSSRSEPLSNATGAAPSEPAAAAFAAQAASAAPAATAAVPPPPPAPLITAALPRATFWIRMAALLIDGLLIAILFALLDVFDMLPGQIWLIAMAIYGAVMWKLKGTTVGGIVCGVHLVRLDGRPIDWSTAIVRALGCFLSVAIVGLGFLWILFDPERQAWHDKIAGTAVVVAPKGVSLV